MTDAANCPNCGAARGARGASCRFCGAATPRARGAAPGPDEAIASRLAAVREHARFPALLGRSPSTEWVERTHRWTSMFGMIFAGVAGIMLLFTCGFGVLFGGVLGTVGAAATGVGGEVLGPDGAGVPSAAGGGLLVGGGTFVVIFLLFGALPMGFIALGIWFVKKGRTAIARFQAAPLQCVPAYVSGERTHVSGGGQNSSAKTTYHATLQFEDGLRQECTVLGRLAGELDRGDVGVAYVKGDYLLDLERLDI